MTPKSFWLIAIRLLAIYIILVSIMSIPQWFSLITFGYTSPNQQESLLLGIIIFCLVAIFYIIVIRYCLFKTEYIIDKLKLDHNFEEERFELNIPHTAILKIAIIVIGAFLFIDNFPLLFKEVLLYIQVQPLYSGVFKNPQTGRVVLYLLKTLIGYFMFTDSKIIVNFLERKKQQSD
ncbi:MAG: hypothetical protein ABI367_10000 [Mucilaginibacter sp.]